MKFQTAGPDPRSVRTVNGVLAVLYFMVAGMLLYFRLGPFERLLDRFEASDASLPDWFSPVFTVGIGLVGAFLVLRGVSALRNSLRS